MPKCTDPPTPFHVSAPLSPACNRAGGSYFILSHHPSPRTRTTSYHPSPLPVLSTNTMDEDNNNNYNNMGSSGAPTSASSSSSSSSPNSRWNPTKEQISMLEALYRQGVRTPTAEQIQQIAARLREFGNIEGKNVFYWFQNHKARQRQKQKQENLASLSRFFRRAAAASPVLPTLVPIPPTPCASVVCSPYCYPPQGSGIAYYPHVLLPRPVPTRATADLQMYEKVRQWNHEGYPPPPPQQQPHHNLEQRAWNANSTETLQLFPLHPTGVLEERSSGPSERSSTFNHDLEFAQDGGSGEEGVGVDARPVLSFF